MYWRPLAAALIVAAGASPSDAFVLHGGAPLLRGHGSASLNTCLRKASVPQVSITQVSPAISQPHRPAVSEQPASFACNWFLCSLTPCCCTIFHAALPRKLSKNYDPRPGFWYTLHHISSPRFSSLEIACTAIYQEFSETGLAPELMKQPYRAQPSPERQHHRRASACQLAAVDLQAVAMTTRTGRTRRGYSTT